MSKKNSTYANLFSDIIDKQNHKGYVGRPKTYDDYQNLFSTIKIDLPNR